MSLQASPLSPPPGRGSRTEPQDLAPREGGRGGGKVPPVPSSRGIEGSQWGNPETLGALDRCNLAWSPNSAGGAPPTARPLRAGIRTALPPPSPAPTPRERPGRGSARQVRARPRPGCAHAPSPQGRPPLRGSGLARDTRGAPALPATPRPTLPPPHDSLAPESRQPPEFRSLSPHAAKRNPGQGSVGAPHTSPPRPRSRARAGWPRRQGRARCRDWPFPFPSCPKPAARRRCPSRGCLAGENASDLPPRASGLPSMPSPRPSRPGFPRGASPLLRVFAAAGGESPSSSSQNKTVAQPVKSATPRGWEKLFSGRTSLGDQQTRSPAPIGAPPPAAAAAAAPRWGENPESAGPGREYCACPVALPGADRLKEGFPGAGNGGGSRESWPFAPCPASSPAPRPPYLGGARQPGPCFPRDRN
ncbi:basic proline-rich protein-like [Dipodomys spectabilis]|uniref:basic proline-rich protein-like n=1 Tax=Dipodomys spectabilis TaxID=105255 RepID=UPI001C5394A4|nr:basic proline-rich protein-like [Dipodomys spectabilis]